MPGSEKGLAAIVRDRWQVPAALVAALAASVTLYRLLPSSVVPEVGVLLAEVAALEAAGDPIKAADALANLIEMRPPLPPEQRAVLHDRLADVIYRQELLRETPEPRNVRLLLEHADAASELGVPPRPGRSLRTAQAAEWLGLGPRALAAYRTLLDLDPSPEQRRQGQQGLVRLLADRPESRPERQRLLEGLLADEGVSAGYLWWALQESVETALDEGDTIRARLLLGKYAERLKSSDLKGYWDYLWAWVMVHEGQTAEAEPLVQWIDEWLGPSGARSHELAEFGYLPALNRWLLGQIHLAEHRPQAALTAFEEAEQLAGPGELFVAAIAGRARALAALERHDEALDVHRQAVAELTLLPRHRQRAVPRLRASLTELFESLRAAERYEQALEYLALLYELLPPSETAQRLELLETLGRTYEETARRVDTPEEQQEMYRRAGHYLETAAGLCELDETRYGGLMWSAAQGYDQAGEIAAVRRVLQRFLKGRSNDVRLPHALLLIGQACEADGQLGEALDWYGRLVDQYPTVTEAFRARLLRAGCWRALGQVESAERELVELLEDGAMAPAAVIFHDALLELCNLLYHNERYADAISRLEDYARLYPDTPQRYASRFLLADAYRRSAYALRESPPPGADAGRVATTAAARFTQAAELFGALTRDLAAVPERDEALDLYDRLATFYQADCLFELNEAEPLAAALEIYLRAAARYEQEPPALTAQVQIANINLRQGNLRDAARALERARWLLRNIPDGVFAAHSYGADRAHWERYLSVLASSDLFANVFADGP